jgi:hypothetical protein
VARFLFLTLRDVETLDRGFGRGLCSRDDAQIGSSGPTSPASEHGTDVVFPCWLFGFLADPLALLSSRVDLLLASVLRSLAAWGKSP